MEWDFTKLKGLEEALNKFPEIVTGELSKAMAESLNAAKQPVSVPGARPQSPIGWDTDRQRRAFFYTNGFGMGIPTKRTNTIVSSWKTQQAVNSNTIVGTLFNASENAGYVMGNPNGQIGSRLRQQPMFIGYWTPANKAWAAVRPTIKAKFNDAIRTSFQIFKRK